jgi:hypothetical protein
MRQSVLGQRVAGGSSGVGFGFRIVKIMEVRADANICIANDVTTNETFQLGLNKRGDSAVWPQVDEGWLIDRHMGHWALASKITETSPPSYTGSWNLMDIDLLRLVSLLSENGLIKDDTTASTPFTVTGSRDTMNPALTVVIDMLVAKGLLQDSTTAVTGLVDVWQTPTLNSPWANFNPLLYESARYRIRADGDVEIGGLVKTTSSVTGTSVLFTMPAAYCPPVIMVHGVLGSTNTIKQLEVAANGDVRFTNLAAGTVSYTSIRYRFSRL